MEVRAALLATADRHSNPGFDYGHGRIDVRSAIHSAPLVYPLPFSLVSPDQGAELDTLWPEFRWRASDDPDQATPVSYTLVLQRLLPPSLPINLLVGTDTSFVADQPLAPETSYRWEVIAEDVDGYQRVSREGRTFHTPPSSTVGPHWPPRPTRGIEVSLGPNPFRDELPIRVVGPERAPTALSWSIVSPAGRRIAGGHEESPSGRFQLTWNARDHGGELVPAGVYYLELVVGATHTERTIVRLASNSSE